MRNNNTIKVKNMNQELQNTGTDVFGNVAYDISNNKTIFTFNIPDEPLVIKKEGILNAEEIKTVLSAFVSICQEFSSGKN